MDWLFNLIGLASALLLIATAFMYLFNPRMGLEWLKKGGIALLLLLLVPALAVELVHASDPIKGAAPRRYVSQTQSKNVMPQLWLGPDPKMPAKVAKQDSKDDPEKKDVKVESKVKDGKHKTKTKTKVDQHDDGSVDVKSKTKEK